MLQHLLSAFLPASTGALFQDLGLVFALLFFVLGGCCRCGWGLRYRGHRGRHGRDTLTGRRGGRHRLGLRLHGGGGSGSLFRVSFRHHRWISSSSVHELSLKNQVGDCSHRKGGRQTTAKQGELKKSVSDRTMCVSN